MTPGNEKRELSIVVPVYNENETIEEFFRRTKNAIDNLDFPNWSISLILVNDGSNDSTAERLKELADSKLLPGFSFLPHSRQQQAQLLLAVETEHSDH